MKTSLKVRPEVTCEVKVDQYAEHVTVPPLTTPTALATLPQEDDNPLRISTPQEHCTFTQPPIMAKDSAKKRPSRPLALNKSSSSKKRMYV
jgi:hypothetical protein